MNGLSLRPLSIGEVLDRAFQIYRGRFPRLILVAVVCYAPMGILAAALNVGASPAAANPSTAAAWGFLLGLLVLVGMAICWTALAKVCDGTVVGEDVGLGRAVGTGLRLLPRMILFGILAWILSMGAMIPAVLVGVVLAVIVPKAAGAVVMIVAGLGFVASAVLGLVWVTPILLMGLPAVVGERMGALAALKRANELGRGARLRTTALALVAYVIMVLPVLALYALVGMGGAFTGHGIAAGTPQVYVVQVVGWGVGALTVPFYVAVMVMAYYERRVRSEGYDVEMASEALSDGAGVA